MANSDSYPDDLDKILFLSYMSEGDANSWKEEFFETAEQIAAQTKTTIDLGTYTKLIDDITKDFSPYDAPKDAIYEMKELKMGNNTSIEEHVSKFKMLVTQSKLAKNDAVTEYFRESLPIALQKNVMSLAELPTTLDDWYKWAIKLHNNFIRMRSAIAKAQGKTGTSNSTPPKKTHEREP